MVDPGRRPLAGWLEVDESTIDYRTKEDPVAGGQGRGHDGKWAVIGAVEVIDDHPGRIRLATIADYSADSLDDFIKANVGAAATAKTDGWSGYPGVPEVDHDPHVIGPMAAHIVLPWIHRVLSNLKTWALGVNHGLRRKHLQADLDEFAFRFNRRRSRHPAFRRLLGLGPVISPAAHNMLIAPEALG